MLDLNKLFNILYSKHKFMLNFMDFYICKQIKVARKKMLNNKDNFNKIIDLALNTRRRKVKSQYEKAKNYFNTNYYKIKHYILKSNLDGLREIIYLPEIFVGEKIGVGQKIGSFILELLIHYGENNKKLENKLYLPIDSHVRRMYQECIGIEIVPNVNCSINNKKFQDFDKFLRENLGKNKPIIYLDYLWFVGKVFCTKKYKNNIRGYRLCQICWLKDICIFENKWLERYGSSKSYN